MTDLWAQIFQMRRSTRVRALNSKWNFSFNKLETLLKDETASRDLTIAGLEEKVIILSLHAFKPSGKSATGSGALFDKATTEKWRFIEIFKFSLDFLEFVLNDYCRYPST